MTKVISAQDLRIDLADANEQGLFKWLIASFLMGKRIQAEIAAQAYRVIVDTHGRDTPRKLAHCTHRELVAMLGEAHCVRYDETTAKRLLALASKLNDDYAAVRKYTLKDPTIKILDPKEFYGFMESIGKAGSQNKFPRVMNESQSEKWLNYLKDRQLL